MRVLIIGSGGREHALALSISLSEHVEQVFCCPGNPGISQIAQCSPIEVNDFSGLADFARQNKIDLTIIGPDEPLANGIVDYFTKRGLKIFGPTKDAAKLEWSKYFAKEFMLRRAIPSAKYAAFDRSEHAIAYSYSRKLPIVIKADGLAKGKGVTVANTYDSAIRAINDCFDGKFGEAGKLVIVEDFLTGFEASVFAICDGENYALLPTAKDYKRLLDNDKGPNTGGMGAVSPNPLMTPEILKKVEEQILKPTLKGMKEEGKPYKGFLYLGLMINEKEEPFVIEFNSRLGDPETQVVLPLLECDLFEVIWQASEGDLGYFKGILPSAETSGLGAAICVIMSSEGYPEKVADGMPIRFKVGLALGENSQLLDSSGDIDHEEAKVILFQAGTKLDKNRNLITAGGRVLSVTALAGNLKTAIQSAYKAVNKIDFAGKQNRTDIGK
jgi:phosphoribosylamine---glycine ligase